ncbi:MAG: T9SS type A sorting domain-containing protein [Bacteroidia bacterium]|nr:T9SS type A sorting domain-containing protein [Bacteroidia bacterium]
MSRPVVFLCFFAVFCCKFYSQHTFVRNDSIKVFSGAGTLLNPWAGGINSTQFSSLDVDLDGIKDIVTFDKGSFKIRCFKNTGSANFTRYKHAPQFENFPEVTDWVLFKDYNNDGYEDLFTYTTGGVRVYKNTSATAGSLHFTLAYNLLYSDYQPAGPGPYILNLYVSPVGLPGLVDMDNDGDLDILTFSVFGTQIEYHENRAIELGLPLDSLKFFMVDNCWGDFSENTCSSNLNICPLFKKWQNVQNPAMKSNLHAGSCLMCLDNDGDGDQDVILGDISCDSVEFFRNGGSIANAHADTTSKSYPIAKPVKMPYFPCTYYVDTDNDGVRDLLVSPNITPASENFQSVWRFKNSGTDSNPLFTFLENNFLQDSMIDVGEGAYPAMVDENGDGLLDLVVGNYGYFNNPNYNSRLALLRNTGTAALPQFSLITRNYSSLGSFNIQNMAPAFGDLDGDGDADMLIGDYGGQLTYFENVAGMGNTANYVFSSSFYKSIDAGNNAMPQIVDVDRDGKNDILIGGRDGKVRYYKNTGTSTVPNFSSTATSAFLGGVNVSRPGYITGFAAPCLMDVNGSYELLVGCERGYLYRFTNVDLNLTGNFTLVDSIGWGISDGSKIAPAVGNINNDGMPDMILGNFCGGLSYYAGDSLLSGIQIHFNEEEISLYPNPAFSELTLSFENKTYSQRQINIIDLSGRIVKTLRTNLPVVKIDLGDVSGGMYFIQYKTNSGIEGSKRFIVSK